MHTVHIFPGQHSGERILLLLRRHWFVLAASSALFILFLLLPLLVRLLVPIGVLAAMSGTVWDGVSTLALSGYYLFLWLFFFTVFTDYYLDVWILTNERIINIEQVGLFHRVISEQRLLRVQDVTSDIRGIFPTFLNYGNVFVQTAGERERFVFLQVPDPNAVKKAILQASEAALQGLTPDTERRRAYAAGEPPATPRVNLHPDHS